jgi:two-component system, OmpR family, phosphate regulon sensor histidine kinase PhoR
LKKEYIQILIVLITTAFIGLISIQVYWINNSILLLSQKFDDNVANALSGVVTKLETMEYYQEASARKSSGWVTLSGAEGSKDKRLIYETQSGSDTIRVPIKSGSLTALPGTVPLEKESDLPEMKKDKRLKNSQDSLLYSEYGDYGLEQSQILEQSGILDDIMNGLVSVDISVSDRGRDIVDRVNPHVLDSLLRVEFEREGVKAKYHYGVFNKYHQPEILTENNESFKEQLFLEGYRAQLFPNDVVHDANLLRVYFPHTNRYHLRTMWAMLSLSAVLMLVIMFAFSYTITTIYKQKQVSEIKNDFINNMTHELKTPISTISLACEALSDPDMMGSEKQRKTFINMIGEENKRLGVLVENVLRSAILDKGEMELRLEVINVHDLVKGVLKNIAIQVKKKGGTIGTDLSAVNPVIEADRVHITNLVFNLIDNALKYSLKDPTLTISSEDREEGLVLIFADEGIGITKENQKKIFDKLFRVPTGDVHDVKGFGLGLSYVKAVVERHNGWIDVESELNKGSKFIIYLPANHEKED